MGVGGRKDYFQLRELVDVLRRLLMGGGGRRILKQVMGGAGRESIRDSAEKVGPAAIGSIKPEIRLP